MKTTTFIVSLICILGAVTAIAEVLQDNVWVEFGKADLLRCNESAASNIVHLMDGLSIKDTGGLRPTDNTWQLAQ